MPIYMDLKTDTGHNLPDKFDMGSRAFDMEELIADFAKGEKSLNVLLLADDAHSTGCCSDYIRAIQKNSRHTVKVRNPRAKSRFDMFLGRPRIRLKNESGEDYDVVIIHYSICILFENYFSRQLRESLRTFRGIKIQIIQDEYRWVDRMMSEMVYLGIDGILSLVEKNKLDEVYHHPALKDVLKVSSLAGYVSSEWVGKDTPSTESRSKHLIYRGNHLPAWLGHAAHEKTTLTNKYLENLSDQNLVWDISSDPNDRIYGEDWFSFMKSGKAVIGLEGGASIFDFDESAEKGVRKYLRENPAATFDQIHAACLSSIEGNVIYRMITPRSFEAISMRTVQVLYPGEYSGILEAWKHYLPMKRDFSNANEICDLLKNDRFLQKMADETYEDIIESGKFGEERLGLGVDSMIEYLKVQIRENSLVTKTTTLHESIPD